MAIENTVSIDFYRVHRVLRTLSIAAYPVWIRMFLKMHDLVAHKEANLHSDSRYKQRLLVSQFASRNSALVLAMSDILDGSN